MAGDNKVDTETFLLELDASKIVFPNIPASIDVLSYLLWDYIFQTKKALSIILKPAVFLKPWKLGESVHYVTYFSSPMRRRSSGSQFNQCLFLVAGSCNWLVLVFPNKSTHPVVVLWF